MALEDIEAEDTQAMMDRFSHLSQKTIKGALAVLFQIMKYAVYTPWWLERVMACQIFFEIAHH